MILSFLSKCVRIGQLVDYRTDNPEADRPNLTGGKLFVAEKFSRCQCGVFLKNSTVLATVRKNHIDPFKCGISRTQLWSHPTEVIISALCEN